MPAKPYDLQADHARIQQADIHPRDGRVQQQGRGGRAQGEEVLLRRRVGRDGAAGHHSKPDARHDRQSDRGRGIGLQGIRGIEISHGTNSAQRYRDEQDLRFAGPRLSLSQVHGQSSNHEERFLRPG